MAAGPAAGPSTSKTGLKDLYGDLNQDDEDLDRIAEANELYDAVLTGSVDLDKKVTSVAPKKTPSKEEAKSTPVKRNFYGKLALYVGNFPWWTSDKDIMGLAQRLGVKDIEEIKFAENKVNGQSRGYAEVVVTSEESLKLLLEKIPQCELNGDRIDCGFANRQNLSLFEDLADKRIPMRVSPKDVKDFDIPDNIPLCPPPIPPLFPSHPLANRFPPLSSPFMRHPPSPFSHMPPNIPPPTPPPLFHHPVHLPSQPSSSLHVNPAFFSPAQDGHSSKAYSQQQNQSTDRDFEELMNRNKAVASSAISKAVSGATTGDLRVAMETLLTAIAIIKQSRVYGDERCQALVTSLKDCLVSIQANDGYRNNSRSEKKEERDRDRGRGREDSSEREAAGMSRRHRQRSRSSERSKERSRERERHRDHRDRYR